MPRLGQLWRLRCRAGVVIDLGKCKTFAAGHNEGRVGKCLGHLLPLLGGYEVCQELRRFYGRGHLPILMFTVLVGLNDDIRGFASGADAYLNKRCAPNRLFATVNQLLRAAA